MLIVLPPSETKTRPGSANAPLNLSDMSFPHLSRPREMMVRAAARTARMKDGKALLGIPASAPELAERMAHVDEEPCGAPLDVYTGVLYDALGSWDLCAGEGADDSIVLITSALLGLIDCATDSIPAYRLSAGSTVSRLGKAGTWWKQHLTHTGERLVHESPVIIDCRSGAYRSMMPLKAPHVLAVSPVAEREGSRSVVSHDAKRYRGLVARALLSQATAAKSPMEVVEVLRSELLDSLGVELQEGAHGSTLTIVDRWESSST